MVANDDLEGKTTHFTDFYTHTISGSKIPKLPKVEQVSKSKHQLCFFDPILSFLMYSNLK